MPHHNLPLSAPALASRRRPLAGEDEIYAKSRRALLVEEIHLRRQIAQIAELRRALPAGPLVDDHIFRKADHGYSSLSRLFGDSDTLILYACDFGSLGPAPLCYHFLAGLQGNLDALRAHAQFALVSCAPAADVANFAEHHQWQAMQIVQIQDDHFISRLNLRGEDGNFCPSVMIFKRCGPDIRLFWKNEIGANMADDADTPSEMFDMSSLWMMLDLTPSGRIPQRQPVRDYFTLPTDQNPRPDAASGRWPRPVYDVG
ncbi:DUF899 family protein [Sphingopyxis yananensis]|uniref:DUF899 family protein n=1 Tax=Sphingopyxis yananensis TaxID=2886687 RepID=UPI001D0FA5DE|nr:DUF899 family protein [Sphingopyxis yananensis]MCC2601083.1 DUF899 family protein [Sphingopyxis yananensis]